MARIDEIETRLTAIAKELNNEDVNIDALYQETDKLTQERQAILDNAQKRNNLLKNIASGSIGMVTNRAKDDNNASNYGPDSPQYRTAWLKHVRGLPMDEIESRAFSNTAGAGKEVIPTQTANQIITKIQTLAPMLGEVTLLHVPGAVRFAVEGTNNAAAIHTENATITAAADTLTEVSLTGYEIAKLVQISDTVMQMSIDAFESWITTMLAESIARKIEDLIINGTGSTQPTGIEKATTWTAGTNMVEVGASANLTAADVQTLIGLLPAGYDATAKFAMKKKTLFTSFMPLQDNSKNKIVSVEGKNYYIYGYPVLISDYVADNVAYLGAFNKVVANLAENISVKSAYDINTNSYKYSGIAIFDCKPALAEAFVKLSKAAGQEDDT